jgi:hypothetical protein
MQNQRQCPQDFDRRYAHDAPAMMERYIRPHDALGSLPPARYRERLLAAQDSTSELST